MKKKTIRYCDVQVGLRMQRELKKRLDMVSKLTNKSVAWHVRIAVDNYLCSFGEN